MGIISIVPGAPIQIQDQHTPVKEIKRFKGIFRTLEDAAFVTGFKRDDVIESANTGAPATSTTRDPCQFVWPDRNEIQKLYPNYRVVKRDPTTKMARPTTVHLRMGGEKAVLHYRSMMAARECWQLSSRVFNHIVAQSGGWKKHLPPAVTRIEVHEIDWKVPDGYLTPGEPGKPGPLFECRILAGGKVRVRMPTDTFASLRDTPQAILSNCAWKV
jgi:hypothetical protein